MSGIENAGGAVVNQSKTESSGGFPWSNGLPTFTPDFSLNTGHLAGRTFKHSLQQCLYLIIINVINHFNHYQ